MSEESKLDEETVRKDCLPFRLQGKLRMLQKSAFLYSACSCITSAEQAKGWTKQL